MSFNIVNGGLQATSILSAHTHRSYSPNEITTSRRHKTAAAREVFDFSPGNHHFAIAGQTPPLSRAWFLS